jgi:tRNA pseudouridine-54 N-methylase
MPAMRDLEHVSRISPRTHVFYTMSMTDNAANVAAAAPRSLQKAQHGERRATRQAGSRPSLLARHIFFHDLAGTIEHGKRLPAILGKLGGDLKGLEPHPSFTLLTAHDLFSRSGRRRWDGEPEGNLNNQG